MSGHSHNGYERGTLDLTNPARCIGCGCTDDRSCREGCTWLAVNRRERTGVCSNCPDQLPAWTQAQRTTSRRS